MCSVQRVSFAHCNSNTILNIKLSYKYEQLMDPFLMRLARRLLQRQSGLREEVNELRNKLDELRKKIEDMEE